MLQSLVNGNSVYFINDRLYDILEECLRIIGNSNTKLVRENLFYLRMFPECRIYEYEGKIW